MLRAAHGLLFAISASLAILSMVALAANPLALPLVLHGASGAQAALERSMARTVDARWLLPRLETAVAEDDADRAAMLLTLGKWHGVTVPDGLRDAATALADPGFLAASGQCAACFYDVARCRSVAQIVACSVPIELTPLGDVNALRRQAGNWAAGKEVDRFETSLALVGLGATALVVFTGGSGAAIKAGATLTRTLRRSGRLTPRFSAALSEATDISVNWSLLDDYIRGGTPLSEVTDVARLGRLAAIAENAARLHRNVGLEDTLGLLRHVDTPDDLARLARLSDSAGDLTRPAVETLGLTRALRATIRLFDVLIALAGLLTGLLAWLVGLLAARAMTMLRRRLPRALGASR